MVMMLRNPLYIQLLLVTLVSLAGLSAKIQAGPEYLGVQACKGCHAIQYEEWQQSHHSKAMALATADNVLGDFSGNSANFQGVESRFYRGKEHFLVDTVGRGGTKSTFAIKYTFGFYPLQQYLVELDNGHIQALNIAWDARSSKEG